MRLPTQPRARGVLIARFARAVLTVALALSLSASAALASRWTVDPAGGGDFTTIQAALDQQAVEFRDTVLVMPGEYAETITPPVFGPQPPAGWDAKTALVSAGGAAVTAMQSITAAPSAEKRGYANIDGFTFTGAVTLSGHRSSDYPFVRCVFMGPMNWSGGGEHYLEISDCDFYARTTLRYFYGPAQRLRFHSAPLTVSPISGLSHFTLVDCVFAGPADTLVYVSPPSDEIDTFERCVFSNAGIGIAYEGRPSDLGYGVASCVFRDLSKAGIWMEDSTDWSNQAPSTQLKGLYVFDSRFERCGTAVHWVYQRASIQARHAVLRRDTILASGGDALVLGPGVGAREYGIVDCIVDGSGGSGAVVLQSREFGTGYAPPSFTAVRTQFSNNVGDGLFIQDTLYHAGDGPPPGSLFRTVIKGCTFIDNGGAGLRIEAPSWDVDSCLAHGNGERGFALRATIPGFTTTATRNTSVLNRGDGFRFSSRGTPADSLFFIERNLAVMNTGAGIRVPFDGGLRHFAFNDAWSNYLAQYVAPGTPADSNLTVDPRFCALGAGDLTLEQGSPCGAGGVYGLIGALPEACPNTLAAGPGAPAGIAFAVRPSVARGEVEFVPPATGGEGVVEVFDLAGRVLWRAPLGPAAGAVRWRGEGREGRLRAGLYWARFTRGEERVARRLVWLE